MKLDVTAVVIRFEETFAPLGPIERHKRGDYGE
jgi:hypothetical protein